MAADLSRAPLHLPWRTTLRRRLLVSYLVVTVLVLATVHFLALTFLERSTLNQRRESLVGHARVVAGVSAQYMLKGHDYLEYIARDYGQQVGARVLVLNEQGRVLYDSFYEDGVLGSDQSIRPEVASALIGQPELRLDSVPGAGRTLFAAAPVLERGKVVGAVLVLQEVESVWDDLASVSRVLLLVSGAALILALGAGWLLAASLARPVSVVTQGVRAVERGDLSYQVPVLGQDELGRLAEAFNKMSARLARVEESRKAFVANAAHELRTPLASLRALVEPLLSGAVEPDEQAGFLQDIGREVDRLAELAGDLLTLSELEAGRPLHLEPVDLQALLARVRTGLLPLARESAVDLQVTAAPEMVVQADGLKLERAIYNLAHNAIIFSPHGGTVSLAAGAQKGSVEIAVSDQGQGIPPEDLPYIFERFYRSERSRSRLRGGAGLGLAIGREIIQRHGGQITVDSKAKEGTRFVIQIPS